MPGSTSPGTTIGDRGETVRQLHNLLHGFDGTRELVVSRGPDGDVLKEVWRAAQDEADDAYGAWQEHGGTDAYLLYRASADRADAALDALVAQAARYRPTLRA